MKFFYLLLTLSLFVFISGCSEIERVSDEVSGISQPKDDNQTSFIIPIDTEIVDMDVNDTTSGVTAGDTNETNATVGVIKIDAKNAYKVSVRFSDEYNEKGYYSRDEIGELFFDITNIYTNEAIDTNIIEYIILEMEEKNSDVNGTYLNFITYTGEQGPKYSIPKDDVKSSDNVALKINDLSGTTNIIFSVKIEKFDTIFQLKVPIVIEKNKSSSMAIVPMGSKYEDGLFIDKFVIHVVDSYGNKAIDGTRISTGVINNPKLYSNAYDGGRLEVATKNPILSSEFQIYNKVEFDDQTLPRNIWGDVAKFDYAKFIVRTEIPIFDENNTIIDVNISTSSSYYKNIFYNLKNDKAAFNKSTGSLSLASNSIDPSKDTITPLDTLIILANKGEHKPTNLGGWDIKSIDSDSTISLISLDNGENIEDVSYVIGDEYRYDECRQTIMNAAASTFEVTDVKDGIAYAELRYVPSMVGKNIFIYANSRLNDKHIGISRKVVLTGTGLESQTLSCSNKSGDTPDCSMRYRMIQNGSGHVAKKVYISQPTNNGEAVYRAASASRTDCGGWTTISIYGIQATKTATVSFGDFISDELIINQN